MLIPARLRKIGDARDTYVFDVVSRTSIMRRSWETTFCRVFYDIYERKTANLYRTYIDVTVFLSVTDFSLCDNVIGCDYALHYFADGCWMPLPAARAFDAASI